MINYERHKLKVKVLLRRRMSCESIAESSQSHRIDTPTNGDAYRPSENSIKRKGKGDTDSTLSNPSSWDALGIYGHESFVKLSNTDWRRLQDFRGQVGHYHTTTATPFKEKKVNCNNESSAPRLVVYRAEANGPTSIYHLELELHI